MGRREAPEDPKIELKKRTKDYTGELVFGQEGSPHGRPGCNEWREWQSPWPKRNPRANGLGRADGHMRT